MRFEETEFTFLNQLIEKLQGDFLFCFVLFYLLQKSILHLMSQIFCSAFCTLLPTFCHYQAKIMKTRSNCILSKTNSVTVNLL